jgi:hypothetical protein
MPIPRGLSEADGFVQGIKASGTCKLVGQPFQAVSRLIWSLGPYAKRPVLVAGQTVWQANVSGAAAVVFD